MLYPPFLACLLVVSLPVSSMAQAPADGGRIYVQRIEFLGADGIDDEVLRRQMLQLEGTFLNTVALEQSRLRLERLPYVERASVTRRPVKGAPDQVDLLITITEAPARFSGGGGAYSESRGASVFGYFINENLLGSGQRFLARVETSEIQNDVELAHSNPFVRIDGVSRTIDHFRRLGSR